MSMQVRGADLYADQALIVNFLSRNHVRDPHRDTFEWLYRANPAGQARVWVSTDCETQATVGLAAAFPRRMYVRGRQVCGWVLGDFAIDPRYRSLGPAAELQRACLENLQSASANYYDFPSASMVAVYRRLGINPDRILVRMAKPLRVDRKLRSSVGDPGLARVLGTVANAGLALGDLWMRTLPEPALTVHRSDCGQEFTELADRLSMVREVCLLRSAEYLNWRFFHHPYRAYTMLILREAGRLRGYAVVAQDDDTLDLVDLLAEPEALPQLVRGVIRMGRELEVQSVTTAVLDEGPWLKALRGLGFHRREQFPVVTCWRRDYKETTTSLSGGWFLTNGDRES